MYEQLAFGRSSDPIPGQNFRRLILGIASKPDGYAIALNILHMRLHSDMEKHRVVAPEIIDAGRELLRQAAFAREDASEDYRLGIIVKTCLAGDGGVAIAQELVRKFRDSVTKYHTLASYHHQFLEGLVCSPATSFTRRVAGRWPGGIRWDGS